MAKFQYGNMYYMKYNPKLKEILPFWDKQPLMIPLHIMGDRTLGLNIHWLPMGYRKKFVEFLLKKTLELNQSQRRNLANITYAMMKSTPQLKNSLKGIRMYINNRATQVKRVPYRDIASFYLPKQMNPQLFRSRPSAKVYKK